MNKNIKISELENICYWYQASRIQRDTELIRGDGFEGTKSYKDIGCYQCDGLNNLCEFYTKEIRE